MKKSTFLRIGSIVFAVMLIVAAVFVIRETRLEKARQEAIAFLEERAGEYDDSKIVLYDTSKARAEMFAEKLGATLRITKNGEFATLTLPEGVSIADVYADKSNREYIDEFSADFNARISGQIVLFVE